MGPPSPTLRMVSTGRGGPAAASAPGHTPHSPRSPRGSSHSALWQDQGVHDGLHGKLVSDEEQRSQKQLCALSRTGWALLRRGAGWADNLSGCPFSQLELLERRRAQVLEQCARCIQAGWRRHRHRKQERQRRAAVLIQAGRTGALGRSSFQAHRGLECRPYVPLNAVP